jgi:hypothetical protein
MTAVSSLARTLSPQPDPAATAQLPAASRSTAQARVDAGQGRMPALRLPAFRATARRGSG